MTVDFNRSFKGVVWLLCLLFFCVTKGKSQCRHAHGVMSKIISIENSQNPLPEKFRKISELRDQFTDSLWCKDSAYARLLHRMATLQFQLNDSRATDESIEWMRESLAINTSGINGASARYALNSYYNLGVFYQSIGYYNKSLAYLDSVISIQRALEAPATLSGYSRILKADILFRNGDYQQCIEECIQGLAETNVSTDKSVIAQFFNRRAQSYYYLNDRANAVPDTDSAVYYTKKYPDDFERATAFMLKAMIASEQGFNDKAEQLFDNAIALRKKTGEYTQVADDYTDWGNFYFLKKRDYKKAQYCYEQTIVYAKKTDDAEKIAKGYINLAELAFRSSPGNAFAETKAYYQKGLSEFGLSGEDLLDYLPLSKYDAIGDIDLLLVILNNKTELLLNLYKLNGDGRYLDACLATARLTDTVIEQSRREQTGERSRLYWRGKTRMFFAHALEACYLANDMPGAFYFMEKSRAVLLSDKLKELGASSHLSQEDSDTEQNYKAAVVYEQQKLAKMGPLSAEYRHQQLKWVEAKELLRNYIKTLEQKYPLYYQYKYADDIPDLRKFELVLAKKKASFVHYFLQDSLGFALVSTAGGSRMVKLKTDKLKEDTLDDFLVWCTDKQRLNNHFGSFATASNELFENIFAPLQIAPGRVIVCTDNFLFPFEALTRDVKGKEYLLFDYTFSYVYSAGFLLKKMNNRRVGNDFLGFAPASFKQELNMPELTFSARSMQSVGRFYKRPELLTGARASRNNFLTKVPEYSVVNVFSHAYADRTNSEPVLYMQDSVIRLSELQLLNHPATQFIMLSACFTNVGRNAIGEGVYSLARGFSSAGIPAVSATLWRADESAVYTISNTFHSLISKGWNKDEALRKAKLDFIQQGEHENWLPYYWANMVLIGSPDPVEFLSSGNSYPMYIVAGIAIGFFILFAILWRRKRKKIS